MDEFSESVLHHEAFGDVHGLRGEEDAPALLRVGQQTSVVPEEVSHPQLEVDAGASNYLVAGGSGSKKGGRH